jgi:hypothetical protein
MASPTIFISSCSKRKPIEVAFFERTYQIGADPLVPGGHPAPLVGHEQAG